MGTKNSATGDVERGFSSMNLIHQNKQRNCMHQDTLYAHLHIRSAVECEENIKMCQKCDGVTPRYDHCHFSLTTISADMKANCKKAREKCFVAQNEASTLKEIQQESNLIKYSEVMATERERIEKLKEKLSTKSYFLSSSLMKPVYQNKKGSSNDRNNDRVCSGSKEMVERVTMEKEGRVSIGSKGKEKKNKYKDAEKKKKGGTWEKDSKSSKPFAKKQKH